MIDPFVNNALSGPVGTLADNFAAEAAALIGWWRLAGVDTAVTETPFKWLGDAGPVPLRAAAAAIPAVPPVERPPATLEAFTAWLMTADLPEAGPPGRRVPPAGDPGSGLMILTDLPELADIDEQRLIGGALAPMFDRMLALMGRTRETIWLASLSPGRPPTGRIGEDAIDRLGDIARHHVALVRPRRLWLMGKAASRAILGMDDTAAAGRLHPINLSVTATDNKAETKTDVIATAHPKLLDGSKELKRRAWMEMQRLIAGHGA